MAAQQFFLPFRPAFTSNGLTAPGAKLNFYLTDTSTRAAIYTTSALSVQHSNPVVADSAGRFPPIYYQNTITYKVVLTDADDVTLGTAIDPYQLEFSDDALSEIGDDLAAAIAALQEAGEVSDATFTGVPLSIAKGGTGATSAGAVRTALSLVPGTNIETFITPATTADFYRGDKTMQALNAAALSDFAEAVDDRVNALFVAGTNIQINYNDAANTFTIAATSGAGATLSDGDYGDVIVSGVGTVITIDADAVTYAKMQNVSATDRLLGRSTSGAGNVEEITCTAAGRALLDDADATAQRATLALVIGTNVQAFHANLSAFAGLSLVADRLPYANGTGTLALATFTTLGRTLTAVADAAAIRTAAGLGSIAILAETTTAEYRANTADRALSTDQVWAAADYVALTDGATIAVNMSAGFNFSVTLGGNRTLGNPTSTKNGQTGCIVITQDGTGTRTLAYGTSWEFASGTAPVLSTAAGTKDLLFYQVISSTSIYASLVKGVV